MEIYNLYRQAFDSLRQINYTSAGKLGDGLYLLIYTLVGAFLFWLVFFILQGFGLYAMAKKQGLKKKGLAFVPFANVYYMGKITGECRFFGRKVKHIGTYAMIMQIFAFIATALMIAAELYMYLTYGEPTYDVEVLNNEIEVITGIRWSGTATGLGKAALWYINFGEMIFIPIFGLIYDILMLILVIALYRKYTMRGYLPLAILEFFVPMSRFIVIFVLRNREPIDYEAIMRARREAYIRQQQQYYNQYGNQYGSPYGNPYGNPYGAPRNNPNPAPQPPKQEDPFEEFSSGETNSGASNSSSQNGAGSDDFFD